MKSFGIYFIKCFIFITFILLNMIINQNNLSCIQVVNPGFYPLKLIVKYF